MLMDQPPGAETPPCPPDAGEEQRRALGYNAVARLAGADCARFIAVDEYLRARGLSAPEIFAADPDQGFILMEDFGDRLYGTAISGGSDEAELYRGAVDALARLHVEPAPALLTADKPLYAYDDVALLAEIDLLPQWFFPVGLGRAADPEEVAEHRALWHELLRPALAAPPTMCCATIIRRTCCGLPRRSEAARVGIIDFQDAVAGTRSYDLISLIQDARRDVAPELAEAMTRHYLAAMRRHGVALDEAAHRAEMAIIAAQRNAKIVGIFARLFKRDNKPRYLGHLPRVWGYLNRDLSHPALAPLKAWYDRRIPMDARASPRAEGATA